MLGSFYIEKTEEDPKPIDIEYACSQTEESYTATLPSAMELVGDTFYQHKYRPLHAGVSEDVSVQCIPKEDLQSEKERMKEYGESVSVEEIDGIDDLVLYRRRETDFDISHYMIVEKADGLHLRFSFRQNKQDDYEARKKDMYRFIDSFELVD
ncbi:hypothetical protein [Rossellomorea aquimaris]|uniref:hypothetical protein n=1 Tax=Rossellomorea aquimaris TaxID=189382 RepID=UPI0007D08860|nr:hypothetical protein [Rossellomorea aquimaris]